MLGRGIAATLRHRDSARDTEGREDEGGEQEGGSRGTREERRIEKIARTARRNEQEKRVKVRMRASRGRRRGP